MSDDDGGIVSEIADVVGNVAGAVAGEAKKLGQSATSQVSGSPPSAPTGPNDASVVDQLSGFGKSLTSQVTGGQPSSGQPLDKFNPFGLNTQNAPSDNPSLLGELKKFGSSATSQATGGEDKSAKVAEMAKADKDFSEKEMTAVRARINRVYEEYAAKKAQEKQQEEVVEKQEEQVKEVQEKEVKKEEANVAIQKTRAEIKNYGAE